MRFLVDECTGPAVARWLCDQGHDVFSVYDQARGMSDDAVLKKAFDKDRLLITNDKDFGAMIFRERRPHKGIILLRLADARASRKIETLRRLSTFEARELAGQFVVASENQIRIAQS
jgi:predicted nuclease of predicted toxin-antitoxin system